MMVDIPLHNSFNFDQLDEYNSNFFKLNTLEEEFNPMPLNDVCFDS